MIFTLCFPASTSNRIEPTVVRPNDISLRFRPFFSDLFMERGPELGSTLGYSGTPHPAPPPGRPDAFCCSVRPENESR